MSAATHFNLKVLKLVKPIIQLFSSFKMLFGKAGRRALLSMLVISGLQSMFKNSTHGCTQAHADHPEGVGGGKRGMPNACLGFAAAQESA